MGELLLFGIPGLLIGLLLGVVLVHWRRVALAAGLVLVGYLALMWFTAPRSFHGCGNECYEWQGRYAEWNFVAIFVAANVAGLAVGSALGVGLRMAGSRRAA